MRVSPNGCSGTEGQKSFKQAKPASKAIRVLKSATGRDKLEGADRSNWNSCFFPSFFFFAEPCNHLKTNGNLSMCTWYRLGIYVQNKKSYEDMSFLRQHTQRQRHTHAHTHPHTDRMHLWKYSWFTHLPSVMYQQCITSFKGRLSWCVVRCGHRCLFGFCKHTHTHTHTHARRETGREREREVCSFSWLWAAAENFPSSPPLPAPTSCLHYSRVFFRSNSDDSEKQSWQVEASLEYVRPFAVSSGRPPFCGVLAVGTVSCDPHVHSPFVHGAGSDRGEGRRGEAEWWWLVDRD